MREREREVVRWWNEERRVGSNKRINETIARNNRIMNTMRRDGLALRK